MENGQRLLRVHFRHHPGARTPAALAVRGREYPLDMAGTAWIEPDTGAIARIDANEYGYCESCGVEIGLKRLEARPTATLCIDCKTLDELRERQVAK